MKNVKNLTLILALSLVYLTGQAQVSLGVKTGVNFADTRVKGITSSLLPDLKTYPGWTAGITAEIPMIGSLSFNPELNFVQKGFVADAAFATNFFGVSDIDLPVGVSLKTRMDQVEVPLLLKYNFNNDKGFNTYVFAGPSLGYMFNDEIRPVASLVFDFNLPKIDVPGNLLNKWDVGGVIGAGAQIKIANHGKLFGDVRLHHGFTNVLKNPIIDVDINNRGFQLSAGYAYIF